MNRWKLEQQLRKEREIEEEEKKHYPDLSLTMNLFRYYDRMEKEWQEQEEKKAVEKPWTNFKWEWDSDEEMGLGGDHVEEEEVLAKQDHVVDLQEVKIDD